jgi:adenylosuccinate lyase
VIDRYTLPAMRDLWSEEAKFQTYLQVELAVCDAWAKRGEIPAKDLKTIHKKAGFDIERINEIEAKVKHDVIAFLTSVNEHVGPSGRYIHMGMTSNDMIDTAQGLRMKKSAELILEMLDETIKILARQAEKYKYTLQMGRSHGIHAEPITFGLKLGLYCNEMIRNRERLLRAKDSVSCGKIAGPVGTYASIPPDIEAEVCKSLGLSFEPISNQVVQRDRHAEYLCALAILAATIEKIALEIRHLQRTEVLEAEEPFTKGQKGSSAMPHKRNPVTCEQLCGLARLIRTNAQAGLENIALWHERDISHSSVERIILPDSTTLVHYMLSKLNWVIADLIVYENNMAENMKKSYGLVYSQHVLLALIRKGLTREEAYALVQKNAMKAWMEKRAFREFLEEDAEVTRKLSTKELNACFDPKLFTKHVDKIFKRQVWNHGNQKSKKTVRG